MCREAGSLWSTVINQKPIEDGLSRSSHQSAGVLLRFSAFVRPIAAGGEFVWLLTFSRSLDEIDVHD